MKKIKVLVLGLALGIAGVAYAATGSSQIAHAGGGGAPGNFAVRPPKKGGGGPFWGPPPRLFSRGLRPAFVLPDGRLTAREDRWYFVSSFISTDRAVQPARSGIRTS